MSMMRSKATSAAAAAARSSQACVCSMPLLMCGAGRCQRAMSCTAMLGAGEASRAFTRLYGLAFASRLVMMARCGRSSPSITSMAVPTKYGSCTPPRNSSSSVRASMRRRTTKAGWSRCAVISSGRTPRGAPRWVMSRLPPSSRCTRSRAARMNSQPSRNWITRSSSPAAVGMPVRVRASCWSSCERVMAREGTRARRASTLTAYAAFAHSRDSAGPSRRQGRRDDR